MNNNKIKILKTEILSDNWYTLNKVTFEYQKNNGTLETQSREAYDRGNGATILLYNKESKTVILTKQFRLPTYINGNEDGMMIEACAGLLTKIIQKIVSKGKRKRNWVTRFRTSKKCSKFICRRVR